MDLPIFTICVWKILHNTNLSILHNFSGYIYVTQELCENNYTLPRIEEHSRKNEICNDLKHIVMTYLLFQLFVFIRLMSEFYSNFVVRPQFFILILMKH